MPTMEVIQFYFNPPGLKSAIKNIFKKKETPAFKGFSYSSVNCYEEKLGNLYITSYLEKFNLKNRYLLEKIADDISEEYYKIEERDDSEQSLRKALLKVREEAEELGISLIVFSISSNNKIIISKIGNGLKAFLFRNGKMFDINDEDSNYEIKAIEGRLEEGDLIAVLNQELFEAFWQEGLFKNLTLLKKTNDLKKLFKKKKDKIINFTGVLTAVFIERNKKKIFPGIYRIPLISKIKSKFYEKVFSSHPLLERTFKKGLILMIILIVLILLGYFLF